MTGRPCHARGCVESIAPTMRADTRFCSEKCRARDKRDRKRTGRTPYPRGRYCTPPECSVENCRRTAKTLGHCNRHYENLRRYGDPVPRKDRPLDDRIREVGWTVTPSGCWEWDGPRNEDGYGIFNAVRIGADGLRAHRVVYVHLTGQHLADDELLRHKCDNPPCVNPEHLLPGTPQDNMDDMVERQRHWRHGRAACDEGHDLTPPGAVKNYADGSRCVTCRRARTRRYELRNIGRVKAR